RLLGGEVLEADLAVDEGDADVLQPALALQHAAAQGNTVAEQLADDAEDVERAAAATGEERADVEAEEPFAHLRIVDGEPVEELGLHGGRGLLDPRLRYAAVTDVARHPLSLP